MEIDGYQFVGGTNEWRLEGRVADIDGTFLASITFHPLTRTTTRLNEEVTLVLSGAKIDSGFVVISDERKDGSRIAIRGHFIE